MLYRSRPHGWAGFAVHPWEKSMGRSGRFSSGDQGYFMAGITIEAQQAVHDALDASVPDGRNGKFGVGREEDAHCLLERRITGTDVLARLRPFCGLRLQS